MAKRTRLSDADLAPLEDAMRAHHAKALVASFVAARDHLGMTEHELPFDPKRPAIKRILEKTAERITGVLDETIDRVNGYVQIGLDSGETPDEIAQRIEADESGAFSAARASMIARTETATVYNLGSIAGYRESGRVEKVRIFDGDGCGWTEHDDPDLADGSTRTLDEFEEYPTSHPNCVRAGAPFFDFSEDDGEG